MPSPINDGSPLDPSVYYDHEVGQCSAPPSTASAPPTQPVPEADPGSRAAVDQLVRSVQTERPNCAIPLGKAAVSCLGAAVTIVVGSGTGPGVTAAAYLGGAACGFAVME